MFARNVSFHLKSNMLSDYSRSFDKDILPLLRKQNGFKDEITFSGPGGIDVTAISLWDNKASAENYNTSMYPEVLKTMARFIEGTPKVQTSEVVNSTFHKVAVEQRESGKPFCTRRRSRFRLPGFSVLKGPFLLSAFARRIDSQPLGNFERFRLVLVGIRFVCT